MNNNQVLEYKIINSNKVLVKHKSFRTHRETQQVLINFQTIILSQYHAQNALSCDKIVSQYSVRTTRIRNISCYSFPGVLQDGPAPSWRKHKHLTQSLDTGSSIHSSLDSLLLTYQRMNQYVIY